MRRWLIVAVVVVLGIVLLSVAGCGKTESADTTGTGGGADMGADTNATITTDLVGPIWKMTQMATDKNASDIAPVADGITVTIEFGADGMYFAQAPVNTVRGPFTVEGDKLTLADGAMTQMAGIDDAHNIAEDTFIGLLKRVVSYKIQGNTLSLYDNAGILIMEFAQ